MKCSSVLQKPQIVRGRRPGQDYLDIGRWALLLCDDERWLSDVRQPDQPQELLTNAPLGKTISISGFALTSVRLERA